MAPGARTAADPTAGFEAALFLLHTCSSVYLYGVTVESASKSPPGPGQKGAAAAAKATQTLNWYFQKEYQDGNVPAAQWNRTKAWHVDAWTVR